MSSLNGKHDLSLVTLATLALLRIRKFLVPSAQLDDSSACETLPVIPRESLQVVPKDATRFLESLPIYTGVTGLIGFPSLGRCYLTSSPGLSKYVLETTSFRRLTTMAQRIARSVGDGLLSSVGKKWIQSRRILCSTMSSSEYLENSLVEDVGHVVHDLKCRWQELASNGPAIVNLSNDMREVSMRIGLRLLFGEDAVTTNQALVLVEDGIFMEEYISRPYPLSLSLLLSEIFTLDHLRYLRSRFRYRSAVAHMLGLYVGSHPTRPGKSFLVDHYLHRSGFTDEIILDQVLTSVFSSAITTGLALQWMWILLDSNIHLSNLIQSLTGNTLDSEVDVSCRQATSGLLSLSKNPELRACVSEVLRLYPPIRLPSRQATENSVFDGFRIKRGDAFILNVPAIHRSPQHWRNPNAFDHTRFLGDNLNKIAGGAYLPFGLGAHHCPAATMAITEISLVISLLFNEFEVTILNPSTQRVSRKPSFLTKPDVPILAQISRRNA
jgi:cytochrome P450